MKLLQELRGLAQVATRRPQAKLRWLPLLLWRVHPRNGSPAARRLRIEMQNPVDIPAPVEILHLKSPSPARGKASAR